MKLSVVMPVYNEINTIEEILRRVRAVPLEKEIIVVDDGSRDGTRDFLRELEWPEVKVLYHETNQGKGAALSTGFQHTTGDVVVIQDGDLEYHPDEIPGLIAPILGGKADVVYGSRFLGARRVFMFSHWLGNQVLTLLSNLLFNTTLTDMETCYKAFRGDVARSLRLKARGFGCEPEITARVFRRGLRVYEIPISYDGRTYVEGKKITWRDGFKAIYWLLRCRFTVEDIEHETLRRMAATDRYGRLIVERIAAHIGPRVLEVGSGIGNISGHLGRREILVVSDVSDQYLTILKRRFSGNSRIKVVRYDLAEGARSDLQGLNLDTVICLNVLEHIEDDAAALRGLAGLLSPGGRLILLVPAHPCLYSNLDRRLDHHRRYRRSALVKLLESNGFSIEHLSHFNMLGALGWWVNGRLLRRRILPGAQLRLFGFLSFLLRLESRFTPPFGLSLVVFARRGAAAAVRRPAVGAPVRSETP
ncbi:MAG: glycosyltransferase [Acidobacteriota bacterium]